MEKLKVAEAGMRTAVDQLQSQQRELENLTEKIRAIRQTLPFKVRQRANIENNLRQLANSLSENVTSLKDMTQCLERAIRQYQNCENKIAGNELGSLPDGAMDMVKDIIAAGLVAAKQVATQAEKTFEQNLMTQYGFDERTAKIMWSVYQKIQEKYKDLPQKERDWYFARALSQMGDYNNKEVSWLFFSIETDAWRKGAGGAYAYKKEEEYFCKELGVSAEDYRYLRQMVRLQHFMTSNPNTFSGEALETLYHKNKGKFDEWRKNMESGIGKEFSEGDAGDQEYINDYKTLYNKFKDQGDFSHMMYTISANLNDDGHQVTNRWHNSGAPEMSWGSAEERKDIVGWLGDAVYKGDENKVSFGNDDYIADIDADNIVHRINSGSSLADTINDYYQDLSQGDADTIRTKEFLDNNPYENVEKAILDRIQVKDSNNDPIIDMNDLEGNDAYADTYSFLQKLKEAGK